MRFFVDQCHLCADWDDLVVKLAGLLRSRRPRLAVIRIVVLRLPTHVIPLRHYFGCVDHGHVGFRPDLHHKGVVPTMAIDVFVLYQADGLGASRNDDRHIIDHDAFGCGGDRHHSGRTLTVDAHARCAHRHPCGNGALAGEITSLGALLVGGSHDHVLDLIGLESGAFYHRLNNRRGHAGHFEIIEGTPV